MCKKITYFWEKKQSLDSKTRDFKLRYFLIENCYFSTNNFIRNVKINDRF